MIQQLQPELRVKVVERWSGKTATRIFYIVVVSADSLFARYVIGLRSSLIPFWIVSTLLFCMFLETMSKVIFEYYLMKILNSLHFFSPRCRTIATSHNAESRFSKVIKTIYLQQIYEFSYHIFKSIIYIVKYNEIFWSYVWSYALKLCLWRPCWSTNMALDIFTLNIQKFCSPVTP